MKSQPTQTDQNLILSKQTADLFESSHRAQPRSLAERPTPQPKVEQNLRDQSPPLQLSS